MPNIVATPTTTGEMCALAQGMQWTALPTPECGFVWQTPAMDARITWWALDEHWGALSVAGEHAEVVLGDLATVVELYDDVDVLNSISTAESPDEVAQWAQCLGAFAAGSEVLTGTLEVLLGLLASDRRAFVQATVTGLSHARWPPLDGPLRWVGEHWPELVVDCKRALASIEKNPI